MPMVVTARMQTKEVEERMRNSRTPFKLETSFRAKMPKD